MSGQFKKFKFSRKNPTTKEEVHHAVIGVNVTTKESSLWHLHEGPGMTDEVRRELINDAHKAAIKAAFGE